MKTYRQFINEDDMSSTGSNTVTGTRPEYSGPGSYGGGSGTIGRTSTSANKKNNLGKSGAGAVKKDSLSKKGEDKVDSKLAGQAKRDQRTPASDSKPGHSGPELKKLNPATQRQSIDIHREKKKMVNAGQPRNPNAIAPAKGGPTNKRLASAKKVNQLKGGQDQKALPARQDQKSLPAGR